MKKLLAVLAMLLAISLTIPVFLGSTLAVPVPQTQTTTKNIEWITDGYNFYTGAGGFPPSGYKGKGFADQPEFLMLEPQGNSVPVITDTTITIQGLDALGQPISAQVEIPGTSINPIGLSNYYVFVDPYTGYPVAFSNITNIIQQGGTDGNKFLISTIPESELLTSLPLFLKTKFYASNYFEEYYGQYDPGTATQPGFGWQPGVYTYLPTPNFATPYWVTRGIGVAPAQQGEPFQPLLPEPLTIYVNWHDNNHDLVPNDFFGGIPDTFTQTHPGTIYIETLNENGQKLILSHTFTGAVGENPWWTFDCCSEIDKVWGGSQSDEYYLFATPPTRVDLFYYYITIDHLTIHAASYDILADGASTTKITVALRDIDNNPVNWGGHFANATFPYIYLSFFTSGGTISPSYNVYITEESSYNFTTLTSDTNPRTIRVVCDANVPIVDFSPGGHFFHGDLNLMAWTELTFDGVNIVPLSATWPIHTLQWGYTDAQGISHQANAPAEPALEYYEGGPEYTGIKLDGPLYEVTINLYQGCNLISSPVYPMIGSTAAFTGIPMAQLFGTQEAKDAIEAVWWYDASGDAQGTTGVLGTTVVPLGWDYYIPSTGKSNVPDPTFNDGVGYWIKAEKPCIIELSGVAMENAPFLPAEYTVYQSWNLMGFTSISPMNTVDYLESLATGNSAATIGQSLASAVGPIWTYNAQYRVWNRDPAMLWPTNAFWMNYKLGGTAYLSP